MMMKRFLIILVMLFWCNVGFAFEKKISLFGIYLADDLYNYKISEEKATDDFTVYVDPPNPNDNFEVYIIHYNPKNRKIIMVRGIHRKKYILGALHRDIDKIKMETHKCISDLKDYVKIVSEGKQFKDYYKRDAMFNDMLPLHQFTIYLDELKDHPFKTNFGMSLECQKYGSLEDESSISLNGVLKIMDHRNDKQAIKDRKEFRSKGFEMIIDKSGLDGETQEKKEEKKIIKEEKES